MIIKSNLFVIKIKYNFNTRISSYMSEYMANKRYKKLNPKG